MKHPSRKPNRLHGYNYSSGGSYFITICLQNVVLCHIVERGDECPFVRLTATGEIIDKNIRAINLAEGVTVEHYVIMPDHIHMILFIEMCVKCIAIPPVIADGSPFSRRGRFKATVMRQNSTLSSFPYLQMLRIL